MIDERKIGIIANNLSRESWEKYQNSLQKMIRDAYKQGFKDGVEKAVKVCKKCKGFEKGKEYILDACKSCNKVVIIDE